MQLQMTGALVLVELKKLYRAPVNLVVMLLMPVGLTLVFYLALSGVTNDYYPVPGMNHFEYLLPGVMGYAVIYMGMMVALGFAEYRQSGLLKRVEATPVSPSVYLSSHIIAYMLIAVFQALIVLLVARILGFEPQGGPVGLLLACLFLAILGITAVGLGLLVAAVAKDSGAASGLSAIFIIPMMMFGALLAVFNETTRNIARLMPNFYVSDSLSIIFHTGRVSDPVVWENLVILTIITMVVAVAGVELFKRKEFRSVGQSLAQEDAGKRTRLFYIDHLRAALVILVVLHHVALVYGASLEGYYYIEPPFTDPVAFVALLVFALVNQGWFMGAFFLLAGYFTPGSFDRKGAGSYLKDRLIRLGIPLISFYFVLSPISFIGYYLMPATLTGITEPLSWQRFWQAYPNFIGLGPLWFVAMLLIFSFGYAGWQMLARRRTALAPRESSPLGYLGVVAFIVALALVSYLWRMVIPLGKSVFQFPTLAYLPQYLSFFILGTVATRPDWFRSVRGSMGVAGFVAALASFVFLFPLAFSGRLFSFELGPALDNAMGNGHWQSAVYTLWDSIFAVGLSLGLITLFRRFFNSRSQFGRFLSQHSYTVYIIHIPIVVFLAYALRGIVLGSLFKFVLAAIIIVPACFTTAYLIRKIPLVSRVL